ncbi:MAG TPA: anti-sigma factor [Solirubrobacteraceae bacterium]|nr:anti-sigma factor [Solirubrobacteraceae bacterium]
MSCEHRDDAGAWVLGALPDAERERFAAHLPGCEICTREVADLQMVADTLPLAAPQVAPPPELKERIMSVVRAEAAVMHAAGPAADVPGAEATAGPATAEPAAAEPPAAPARERQPKERRPWWGRLPSLALRPLPAAVAAAVIIAIGVGGGVLLTGGDEARTVEAQVVAPSAPAARASLTTEGERATLRVQDFPPPPSGRVYQVWLKRPNRPPDPTTALFTTRDGDATVEVPGSVEGVEQVLVTAEPDGGSREPTRDPVIIASPA